MTNTGAHFGYQVALFDILGFEQKLKARGLANIAEAYDVLISDVEARNRHMAKLFGEMGFSEAAYWTSEGDVFIFNNVRGAFASDSILLWAHRTWPDVRDKNGKELAELSKSPAHGWKAHPIPCDNFLDTCNELMCHSLEIGLPLRGAISMGEAVIDEDRRVFLGQPIVDAARMEREQVFLGASLCSPFVPQRIPGRYTLLFEEHLKEPGPSVWSGLVLDWPRHWRNTRAENLKEIVAALNTDPQYSACYDHTRRFIDASNCRSAQYGSIADISIRAQYPEFASPELEVHARAVRRVPVARV
jgi:hypothetical protein